MCVCLGIPSKREGNTLRSTIICVDDDKLILYTLANQLEEWVGNNYAVERAGSGQEALEILEDCAASGTPVSVVVSDYIMPGMKGDELLCKVHERDKSIRCIMLTGYSQLEGIINAINHAGLYRFVSKPWDKKDLMLTIIGAIKSYEQEKVNKDLLQGFEKLYRGYEQKLEYITGSIAEAIDWRSGNHAGHSRNVAAVSQQIGKKAGLDADALNALKIMASFHDIGRLILDDRDLTPIRDNEQEFYDNLPMVALQNEGARQVLSVNPEMGAALLNGIGNFLEKFDGTGVRGLKGRDIPMEARIIAVANHYDRFIAGGDTHDLALERLTIWKGTALDPKMVEYLRSET